MKNLFYISDLNVLIRLFGQVPTHIQVWDPEERIYPDQSWSKVESFNKSFSVLIVMPSSTGAPPNEKPELFQLVLNFSNHKLKHLSNNAELKYISNSSGYMRWLYPAENTTASFTQFFSAATVKSKLLKWGFKVLCALHLDSYFLSNKLEVHSMPPFSFANLIDSFSLSNYSFYMGSQGVNRTALMQGYSATYGDLFLKIAVNANSLKSLEREKRALNKVNQFGFEYIKLPEVKPSNYPNVLVTTAFGNHSGRRSNDFTKLHGKAMIEIVQKSIRFYRLAESPFWLEIQNQVALVQSSKVTAKMKSLIQTLFNQIQQNESFYTSMAHGDFTPWNMFVSSQQLNVYDWELADGQYPLFYDLFHFHFQNGVMVKQHNYKQIEQVINSVCMRPSVQELVHTYQLDISLYFQMYVLKSALKNVLENANNTKINYENAQLRDALIAAMEANCSYSELNHRKLFIYEFDRELKKYAHGYLKLLFPDIMDLSSSSDLDIALRKSSVSQLVHYVKSHALVKKTAIRTKSFMTIIEIQFKNGEFLSIDLIHQFKRKSLVFSNIENLLLNVVPNSKGYMIPLAEHDFEYAALFYLLNNAPIPLKYIRFYDLQYTLEGNPILFNFKERFGLSKFSNEEVINGSKEVSNTLLMQSRKTAFLSGWRGMKNFIYYLNDLIIDLTNNRGVMLTLSGVDGAGKSTVIQLMKKELEDTYRKKVVLLRHRPGILPILSSFIYGKEKAEYKASITIPRKGDNKSLLSSVLRFSYYYVDYLFGQFFVFLKYTSRGTVVLYDRYYFDFINDASRSNIRLNNKWIERLYYFIFKPDLNIFLYETPEVILKRKQEMNASQIIQISGNYRRFFHKMNTEKGDASFKCIRNRNLDSTLIEVFEMYQKVS